MNMEPKIKLIRRHLRRQTEKVIEVTREVAQRLIARSGRDNQNYSYRLYDEKQAALAQAMQEFTPEQLLAGAALLKKQALPKEPVQAQTEVPPVDGKPTTTMKKGAA